MISSASGNLCVVGDEDQSIYAAIRNIQDLPLIFRARVVKFVNYRSTQIILDAASAVIAKNTSAHQKALDREAGSDKLVFYRAADDREEASWIVKKYRSCRRLWLQRFRGFVSHEQLEPADRTGFATFGRALRHYRWHQVF